MTTISKLWALRNERPRFVTVSVLMLGFFLAYAFFDWYLRIVGVATRYEYYDWGALAGGVHRWYRGELIYVPGEWGFHGSYLYPPVYLLVLVPFVELQKVGAITALPFAKGPFEASAMLWNFATLGLLWVGLAWTVETCGLDLEVTDHFLLLWALLGFQPVLYSMKMGQVSAFVAAMLCFAFVGMERGRAGAHDGPAGLASGAFTTVGSLVKPFYMPSGAHLLRNRTRLFGAVATGLGLAVLSVGLFGLETNLTYLEVLLWGKGWGADPNPPWLWHPGYYNPLYAVANVWSPLAPLVKVVVVVGVVLLSLEARQGDAARETFALGVAIIPFVAPQAHTLDYVALLVPTVVLVAVEFDRGPAGYPWLPVVAVGALNVQAYGVKLLAQSLPPWLPLQELLVQASPLLQPGLWGNLVLIGLAAYRLAEHLPDAGRRRWDWRRWWDDREMHASD